MSRERLEYLPEHVHLKCYSCRDREATHVRRLDWDGLAFQLCLCFKCLHFEKDRLIAGLLYGGSIPTEGEKIRPESVSEHL
jgi:hypothetical protein